MKINKENYEQYIVNYLEGDLSRSEADHFKEFLLKNPEYQREVELYESTFLAVNTSITFPDKESLKKEFRIKPLWIRSWPYIAAAVCLALFIGLAPLFSPKKHSSGLSYEPIISEQRLPAKIISDLPEKDLLAEVYENESLNVQQIPVKKNKQAVRSLPKEKKYESTEQLIKQLPVPLVENEKFPTEEIDLAQFERIVIHDNISIMEREWQIPEIHQKESGAIAHLIRDELKPWVNGKKEGLEEVAQLMRNKSNDDNNTNTDAEYRIFQLELGNFKVYNRKLKRKPS